MAIPQAVGAIFLLHTAELLLPMMLGVTSPQRTTTAQLHLALKIRIPIEDITTITT